MAENTQVEGDDIRFAETTKVLESRFREKATKESKLTTYKQEWHEAMLVFMRNLEVKGAEKIPQVAKLADAYIEFLKTRFK